jgi:ABC-type Fe3+-hydroxamate transport system substrate-binding protein
VRFFHPAVSHPVVRVTALGLVAATATVTLAACGSASSSNHPGTSGPSGSGQTSPPAVTLTHSPVTGAPTDAAGRVAQWDAGVQSLFAAVQRDTEQIAGAAGKQDVTTLHTACRKLGNDVARVQGAPAAPDKRIEAAVGTAMSEYSKAARSCLAGDYASTTKGINAGAKALMAANSIMNHLP